MLLENCEVLNLKARILSAR